MYEQVNWPFWLSSFLSLNFAGLVSEVGMKFSLDVVANWLDQLMGIVGRVTLCASLA